MYCLNLAGSMKERVKKPNLKVVSSLFVLLAATVSSPSTLGQPKLTIEPVPESVGQVEISWEQSDLSYVLERAAQIYPSVAWADVQNVQLVGNEMRVVINVSGEPQLFRLSLELLGGNNPVMVASISPGDPSCWARGGPRSPQSRRRMLRPGM